MPNVRQQTMNKVDSANNKRILPCTGKPNTYTLNKSIAVRFIKDKTRYGIALESMTNNGGKTFAYAPRKSVQNFSKSEFNATYKSLARNSNMNQQKSATTTYRKNYQQLKERAVDVRPRLQGQNNNSQKLNLSYQNKRSNSLNQNNRREQTKPRQEKPRQGNVSHNETRNVQQKRNEQPRNNVQQRQQYVQHQQRTNNNSPRQITSVLRMGGGQMRMSGSVPSGGGFRRR